jgi:hypothetical protein
MTTENHDQTAGWTLGKTCELLMRNRPGVTGSWWSEPASASGLHHPPGQTSLSHALGVWRVARLAWRRIPWDDLRADWAAHRDFLTAALFHDIGKARSREAHEIEGADWCLERWPDRPLRAYLCLQHSGRWGPCYSERIAWMVEHHLLHLDNERHRWLADLLAGCDYVDAYRHRI